MDACGFPSRRSNIDSRQLAEWMTNLKVSRVASNEATFTTLGIQLCLWKVPVKYLTRCRLIFYQVPCYRNTWNNRWMTAGKGLRADSKGSTVTDRWPCCLSSLYGEQMSMWIRSTMKLVHLWTLRKVDWFQESTVKSGSPTPMHLG